MLTTDVPHTGALAHRPPPWSRRWEGHLMGLHMGVHFLYGDDVCEHISRTIENHAICK
jgi:hypothetical protein